MTNPDSQLESLPPDGMPFFTPVSVGILVQLFCAGLVMAVTAAMSLSSTSSTLRNLPSASNDTSTDAENNASDAQRGRPDSSEHVAVAATSNAAISPENSSSANDPVASTEPAAANATGESAAEDNTNTASGTPNAARTPDAAKGAEMTGSSPDSAVADAGTAAATTPPVTNVRALDDVRQKSRKLPLAGEGLSDEIELCKIFARDPTIVTLEVIGGEFTVPEQITLTLKPFPVDAKSFLWKVSQESTIGLARNQEIGEFILKEQQLSFRWFRNMDKGKLPFCRLKISAGPDSEICDLWSVARSGAAKVRFAKSEQVMDEFVPSGIRLPPFEILELDLTLENWPAHEVSGEKLTFNETITVTFPDDESNKDLITLNFSLDKKEGRYALRGEYLFNAPVVSTRRKKTEVRYDEEELTEDQLKKTSDSLKSSTAKVEKELDSLQQILTVLNNRRADLVQQIANGAGNLQRVALQQVDAQITDKETEEMTLRNSQEELNAAAIVLEKVNLLCAEISNEGQMQYRLFRPFAGDGGDIVIAATITGPAAATITGPAAATEPAAVEESR